MILPGFPRPMIGSGGNPIPVFKASEGGGANSAQNLIIAKPAGTVEGDLLVFWGFHQLSKVIVLPSGWSLDLQHTTSPSCYIATKIAGPSEPASYTFGWISPSARAAGVILCYEGGTGVDLVGSVTRSSESSSTTAASITPTREGVLLGLFGVWNLDATGHTAPSGMAQKAAGSSGSAASAIAYEMTPSPASATGSKTITWSGSALVAAGVLAQIY